MINKLGGLIADHDLVVCARCGNELKTEFNDCPNGCYNQK